MTSERKNISQPVEWWAAFEAQATREGLSLSEWVGECCAAYLADSVREKLPERPLPYRPKKSDS